jgi:hypothetical protein
MTSISPSAMKLGTCTTMPVSRVAAFVWAAAVAPLMPGSVSITLSVTVCGSSMLSALPS